MKLFKDKFQPCCGFSLNGAIRIMSILNVLMIAVGIGLLILDVFQLWEKWQKDKVEAITFYYLRLAIWIAYCVHVASSIPVDYLLFQCSKRESITDLRICFYATFINTTFALLNYYFHTFLFGVHLPTLTIYNGYVIYKYYECAVINYFIKEVDEQREFACAKRALTEGELKEFEEGLSPPPQDLETKGLIDKVIYQRFKKEQYEIKPDKIRYDASSIIGKGAYGSVYRAQLEKDDGYEITVACKTINQDETDVVYFKALLTELKIMSSIGKHENVALFLGAVIEDIKHRKLCMVLEFCALGNLIDFLRGCRGLFRNFVKNGVLTQPTASQYDESPFNQNELVSSEDLVIWSYQIGCGMQFLEFQKVIHGDLAARNVLLTSKRLIKITDFGLSRQLYAYSVYVRKQNTPLPWRHLSIEALTDMQFSSSSDVWAFSVTLYEIFSLSEVPWPGYEFSLMFVEELKKGLRLPMPHYAPHDIYHKLMLQCWNEMESRPNFTQIIDFFHKNYGQLCTRK